MGASNSRLAALWLVATLCSLAACGAPPTGDQALSSRSRAFRLLCLACDSLPCSKPPFVSLASLAAWAKFLATSLSVAPWSAESASTCSFSLSVSPASFSARPASSPVDGAGFSSLFPSTAWESFLASSIMPSSC